MNTPISKETITRIMGIYQAKYGYEMDEWSAMIMIELSEKFAQFNHKVTAATQEIDKATQQIKGQIQPIYFSNEKQAFWFGFGKFLAPSVVALVTVGLLFYLVSTWQTVINPPLNRQEKAIKMFLQMAEIKEIGAGKRVIVLKPIAKMKNAKVGKHYQYIKQENVVYVPLN